MVLVEYLFFSCLICFARWHQLIVGYFSNKSCRRRCLRAHRSTTASAAFAYNLSESTQVLCCRPREDSGRCQNRAVIRDPSGTDERYRQGRKRGENGYQQTIPSHPGLEQVELRTLLICLANFQSGLGEESVPPPLRRLLALCKQARDGEGIGG